jgi:hypothetical protein
MVKMIKNGLRMIITREMIEVAAYYLSLKRPLLSSFDCWIMAETILTMGYDE